MGEGHPPAIVKAFICIVVRVGLDARKSRLKRPLEKAHALQTAAFPFLFGLRPLRAGTGFRRLWPSPIPFANSDRFTA